jgi:phage gp46-like protein
MAIDFKLNQNKGYWDLDIENGDIAKTDSLDTAIYMSVFCEKRANQLSEPTLRRGHFTNQFNLVSGYEVGSSLWLYIEQAKQTDSNLSLIKSAINNGLRWLIEDDIISKTKVEATKNNTQINLEIELINKLQVNSKYYNLFLNL